MIDFRYHLVSIVAVFLALAIGLVVGSTALKPGVETVLNAASKREQQANSRLNKQNSLLSQQLAADNLFAQAASPTVLRGLLDGQSVVLVLAPGADSPTVNGVTAALAEAGATVTGQVVLTPQFFDTSSVTEQALSTTASSAAAVLSTAGVRLPSSSTDPQVSGQQVASQVIAAAIMTRPNGVTLGRAQSQAVLASFAQSHFVQVTGAGGGAALAGQATMAVVVQPSAVLPAKAAGPFNLALVSLTQDLQEAGRGAVLAGAFSGSGRGSPIDVANGGGAGIPLSTVDNADSPVGQILVAQALRELLNPHATPTSYGARPGVVPSPAPSPLPSPSVSSTPAGKPAPSGKKKT